MLFYVSNDTHFPSSSFTNLEQSLIEEIESFLLAHPSSTIFHHPLWIKALSIESGQPFYYIVSRNSEKLINGVLPLLKTKGLPFGISGILGVKRLSSLPRTPYCGPLAFSDDVMAYLIAEAQNLNSQIPGSILQLKTKQTPNKFYSDLKSLEWRTTYIKKIPSKDSELVFENRKTERDIIRNIKRAKENGIVFYEAQNIDDLKIWYKIYLKKMRFHSVPARPFKFFEFLWNAFKPSGLLDVNLAVKNSNSDKIILAGNINYKFKKIYYGGFKAGDMNNAKIMYGDLLLYQELHNLQNQEFEYYDLGEVPKSLHNLERYKRKWGAEKVQIYHSYWGTAYNFNKCNLDIDNSVDIKKIIWRHIPLMMTEKIGNLIIHKL